MPTAEAGHSTSSNPIPDTAQSTVTLGSALGGLLAILFNTMVQPAGSLLGTTDATDLMLGRFSPTICLAHSLHCIGLFLTYQCPTRRTRSLKPFWAATRGPSYALRRLASQYGHAPRSQTPSTPSVKVVKLAVVALAVVQYVKLCSMRGIVPLQNWASWSMASYLCQELLNQAAEYYNRHPGDELHRNEAPWPRPLDDADSPVHRRDTRSTGDAPQPTTLESKTRALFLSSLSISLALLSAPLWYAASITIMERFEGHPEAVYDTSGRRRSALEEFSFAAPLLLPMLSITFVEFAIILVRGFGGRLPARVNHFTASAVGSGCALVAYGAWGFDGGATYKPAWAEFLG